MMFKGQIAIAMTRIGFGEAAPSRRTTCDVMPKRAAISSTPKPRSSASFLKATN